jgi:hypothetical protein
MRIRRLLTTTGLAIVLFTPLHSNLAGQTSSPQASSAATVILNPGNDIQAAIDNAPGGTTFLLKAGDHRITQALVPKTGDTLTGEIGASINGSKLVTNWVPSGAFWVATGQTQERPLIFLEGWPQDGSPPTLADVLNPEAAYPDNVFFNDTRLFRVLSLDSLAPGKFFLIILMTQSTSQTILRETKSRPRYLMDSSLRVDS